MSALFEGHLAYVTGSYLAAGVLLVGLLFAALAERRRARRALAGLEERMSAGTKPAGAKTADGT